MRSQTHVVEEIRRLIGPKPSGDWQTAAARHARATASFVETWTAQLEDNPDEWDAIAEDYNADKARLADHRRALLTVLRDKQAKTLTASRPKRRIPGAVVVSVVVAAGLGAGFLLVHHGQAAPGQAHAASSTTTPTSTPTPDTSTTQNLTTAATTGATSTPGSTSSAPAPTSASITSRPVPAPTTAAPISSAVPPPASTTEPVRLSQSSAPPPPRPSTTSRPPSGGSVTGISVGISGGSGGAELDAQVHVTTSGTGPVTITVTIAGSATNGRPGGDHAHSTTRTLSGSTSYDFTASASGFDYCADYYVGALAAGGGRSAYGDQVTGC